MKLLIIIAPRYFIDKVFIFVFVRVGRPEISGKIRLDLPTGWENLT